MSIKGQERHKWGEIRRRNCPGFVWDRAHLLLSNRYSDMAWIWDENGVINTLMFWLLLFKSRLLNVSCSDSEELHKTLGESIGRTADLN